MKLTAEQIQANWQKFLANIKEHISGNRGEQLLNFYKRYEEYEKCAHLLKIQKIVKEI